MFAARSRAAAVHLVTLFFCGVHMPLVVLLNLYPIAKGEPDRGSLAKIPMYAVTFVCLDTPLRWTLARMAWIAVVTAAKDWALLGLTAPAAAVRRVAG